MKEKDNYEDDVWGEEDWERFLQKADLKPFELQNT